MRRLILVLLVSTLERLCCYADTHTEMPKESDSCKQRKVAKVMREYHAGKLHSGSGKPVTNPKQAKAIAMSEARRKCGGRKPSGK